MLPIKSSSLSVLYFLIFLFTIPLHKSLGQGKSYDEVLYQTVVKTAGSDMTSAKKLADSLYQSSVDPLHKVKSLMLLSELSLTTGHKKEGVEYAFQAEQLAVDNNLYEWQARIYGFIASHYRSIGLKNQRKRYLEKSLEAINHVEDIHVLNQFKGILYQEMALEEIESKHFREGINLLKKADPCFKYIRNKELRLYQLASNFGQLGRAYLEIKDTKVAIVNFNKALWLLSQIDNEAAVVRGFMYEGLGRAFIETKEYNKSKPYLDKALAIAGKSNDLNLNEEVYCDLAIYYMETGDKDKFKYYNKLFQSARDSSIEANKESSEIFVNRLDERQNQITKQYTISIIGFSLILLFLIIVIILGVIKRKKQYKKFRKILRDIAITPESLTVLSKVDETDTEAATGDKEIMSVEVERAILEKLSTFEQGDAFINTSINLATLSVMLETNSKYLSYVINKHKGKDFSNYIGDLRIYYILRKLKSSPEYLNYKISYLAEKAGFSTHSKFTAKFTVVTGMSPSAFISLLRKESKDNN